MDPIYIFLAVLAVVLFLMGLLVCFFQKRILKLNLENTMLFTKKMDISESKEIKDIIERECNVVETKKPVILKNTDTDEVLDFIDDEIL